MTTPTIYKTTRFSKVIMLHSCRKCDMKIQKSKPLENNYRCKIRLVRMVVFVSKLDLDLKILVKKREK